MTLDRAARGAIDSLGGRFLGRHKRAGAAAQVDPACGRSPRHVELTALAESDREPPAFEYRQMTRPEPVEG